MTKAVIQTDPRLFLFQVMEYGYNRKTISNSFLNRFHTEGAQMSFAFAKRYYNVLHEAYLRQSSHCVLGIMNLGLIESAGKNIDKAAGILRQKSYVGVFRQGWTLISNLVQDARAKDHNKFKTPFEWEKDFAETVSAEPGREWIGHQEYQVNVLMYYNESS